MTEYASANSKWQAFKKMELKLLKDQETITLGSSQKNDEGTSEPEEDNEAEGKDTPGEALNSENTNEGVWENVEEKVLLQNMQMSNAEETLVEPKMSAEFASNCYWATSVGNGIEALEADYE